MTSWYCDSSCIISSGGAGPWDDDNPKFFANIKAERVASAERMAKARGFSQEAIQNAGYYAGIKADEHAAKELKRLNIE